MPATNTADLTAAAEKYCAAMIALMKSSPKNNAREFAAMQAAKRELAEVAIAPIADELQQIADDNARRDMPKSKRRAT